MPGITIVPTGHSGNAYTSAGQLDLAGDWLLRLLEVSRPAHALAPIRAFEDLSRQYAERDQHTQAELMLQHAIVLERALEQSLGEEPDSISVAMRLALLASHQEDRFGFLEAAQSYAESAEIYRRIYDVTNSHYLYALLRISILSLAVGDHTAAQQAWQNIVAARGKLLGADHPLTLAGNRELQWLRAVAAPQPESDLPGRIDLDNLYRNAGSAPEDLYYMQRLAMEESLFLHAESALEALEEHQRKEDFGTVIELGTT